MRPRLLRRQRGFSMVELAVVLAIVGLVGVFVWRWLAAVEAPTLRAKIEQQLSQAQASVEGFVLSHNRLPCAAADAAGQEDCSNASAIFLPWRTLGLGSAFARLHYGVNSGGDFNLSAVPDLTAKPWAAASPDMNQDIKVPDIPDDPLDPPLPDNVKTARAELKKVVDQTTARRTIVNGLDWCKVLRRYASDPAAPGALVAGNANVSMPVAFIITHPGANNVFEGNNVIGANPSYRFDWPGRTQDSDYDDISLAVGPADLLTRIGCVSRLSEMQAAAQAAFAVHESARVMREYWSLRAFDIIQAESALEGEETGLLLSGMGFALATADLALSVASAADTEGLTIFGIATATAELATASADLGTQTISRDKAKEELQDSKDKLKAVNDYAVYVFKTLERTMTRAIALDEKGLNP